MMKSFNINIKTNHFRMCAFCKYWYDPGNSMIEPVNARLGFWKVADRQIDKKCMKRNILMQAGAACSDFVSKIDR